MKRNSDSSLLTQLSYFVPYLEKKFYLSVFSLHKLRRLAKKISGQTFQSIQEPPETAEKVAFEFLEKFDR